MRRVMCILEHLLLLLLFLQLSTKINAQQIGSSCNNDKGICAYAQNCPPILINFSYLYSNNKIIFCNRAQSLICCPRTKPTISPVKSDAFLSKACESYYEKAFGKHCEPVPFVVNGNRANPKEFPHMAVLGYSRPNIKTNWFCGGTLISEKFVLTAAHCLEGIDPVNIVRLGELNLSTTADDDHVQDYGVQRQIKHPTYVEKINDIALLELNRLVVFSNYIAPACLTNRNNFYESFLAIGFGAVGLFKESSPHLLKVQLEPFEKHECFTEKQQLSDRNYSSIICAGSRKDNRDTCQGDSGGPLFVEHPEHRCMYLLIGVTSYGEYGCGTFEKYHPAVYQRVSFYIDWIKTIVWK